MKFFATAASGTEGALKDELRALKVKVKADRGGVHFEGDLVDGFRVCLHARVAMRVLVEVVRGPAVGEKGLYDLMRSVDWREHLTARHTFAITATCKSSQMTHSQFIAQRAKDAIVDQLRDYTGQRPSVDTRDPDVDVVLRLVRDQATVYLDLAGEPLHRRGYRRSTVDAMMKETLAAAVLQIAGYTGEDDLLDPLCGAGTILLEGALMARNIAPGLGRRFNVERWPNLEADTVSAWAALREEAQAAVRPRALVRLRGVDVSEEALRATRANAEAAGVSADVSLERTDARHLRPDRDRGWVVTDPPYGDRLAAKPLQLAGFARQLGEALRGFRGHTVAILSGNPMVSRSLNLPFTFEHTLYNGDTECRLLRAQIA